MFKADTNCTIKNEQHKCNEINLNDKNVEDDNPGKNKKPKAEVNNDEVMHVLVMKDVTGLSSSSSDNVETYTKTKKQIHRMIQNPQLSFDDVLERVDCHSHPFKCKICARRFTPHQNTSAHHRMHQV